MNMNRRIIVIDDNPSIHEDFSKILRSSTEDSSSLDAKAALLFGDSNAVPKSNGFTVDSAFQGQEGIDKIQKAQSENNPYAMAFVDVRMPPGMDGVETIEQAMKIDSEIHFVICSAYSDYNSQEIIDRLGVTDRLLLLRKPCGSADILLMATSMCSKWSASQLARV